MRIHRFYALSYSETVSPLPSKFVLQAGSEWARTAQRLILETLDTVTNENVMVGITFNVNGLNVYRESTGSSSTS